MRRLILMMGIAAMAFTSCSKDIVINTTKGHAIDFRVTTKTRAVETTSANLSTFYVTAINKSGNNFYTNATYIKIAEYFCSTPTYYWPVDGSSLSFYAYAPSASVLGGTLTIDNSTKTLKGFSPAKEISDQQDFITATATGSNKDALNGVALRFDHQLAQIEVKAKNSNEGYIYKIAGVRIANSVSKGDFDFTTSEWTLDQNYRSSYQVTYNDPITLTSFGSNIMKSVGDNAMLIPQQLVQWDPKTDTSNSQKGAYISVYAQVTTATGARIHPISEDEYAWLAVPINTEWESGNKYVYTLDFTEGAGYTDPTDGPAKKVFGNLIKIKLNIEPWEEMAR